MNKPELVREISKNSRVTIKEAETALKVMLQSITEALQRGESVSLVGFGQFFTVEHGARVGRNPATGDEINIAASRLPKFKPGKTLKEEINYPINPVAAYLSIEPKIHVITPGELKDSNSYNPLTDE